MNHLGRERMERSLITAIWFVILGALLVAFTLTWGALTEMNRTYPPVIKVPAGMHWNAFDPVTGEPVTRTEWIERALS